MSDTRQISKKKKFVADGVFNAEVHEFFSRSLALAGYAGLSIKNTANRITITVKIVNKQAAAGKNGVRINELERLIEKRFGFSKDHVKIVFEAIRNRSMCAPAQAEFLKAKLLQGAPVRSAAMMVIRTVMRLPEIKGCEIVISGKLRQQRAKTVKYKSGYLISTGQPKNDYVDVAIRHIFFKQGIMGVKVKIMQPVEGKGIKPLPDKVTIQAFKEVVEPNVYDGKVFENA